MSLSHNRELGAWLQGEADRSTKRSEIGGNPEDPAVASELPALPPSPTSPADETSLQESQPHSEESIATPESPLQREARRFVTLASGLTLSLDEQRQLLEDVHRYASVFEWVSNGISIGYANSPGVPLVYVNPAFERMTGYSSHEVLGRNCNFLQGPDTQQPGVVRIREALRLAHDERTLLRNYRKDGTSFWNELYISPVYDLSGQLTHFVGIQNDVTARIEAELAFSEERDRLLAAAESSLDCIYVCVSVRDDAGEIVDFTFTYLNANVAKMVSVPLDELLGGKMCELLPVNRTMGLFDLYKRVAMTGEPLVHEFAVHDRDVRSDWIRVQAVKLNDGVVITASDITLRKRIEHRTISEGQHDLLTALPNRRILNDRIDQAILRTNRQKQLMCVCAIDLDGFKAINDKLGHAAGDETLVIIAGRLRACMRAVDTVVRMGGDEFIVVLPDLRSRADSEMLAARILDELSRPITIAGVSLGLTGSIGIALYPGSAQTAETLLHEADIAMYSAKQKGKNQVEIYDATVAPNPSSEYLAGTA